MSKLMHVLTSAVSAVLVTSVDVLPAIALDGGKAAFVTLGAIANDLDRW